MRLMVCAATLMLGTAACGPRLPDQLVETRWVRYHHWADDAPCAECLTQMDDFIERVNGYLELALNPGFRVDYYKLRTTDVGLLDSLCAPIPGPTPACAVGTTVYSMTWTHEHEVVHAVLDTIGNPPRFFREGIAFVLGCGSHRYVGDPVDASAEVERLVDSATWTRSYPAYVVAGAFTRYLSDTFGRGAFLDFYRHTGAGARGSEFQQAFLRSFGRTFGEVLADWRNTPPSRDGAACVLFDDVCDHPPDVLLAKVGDTASLALPVSCIETVRLVEVTATSAAVLGLEADRPSRQLTLTPCDAPVDVEREIRLVPTSTSPASAIAHRRAELWTALSPGRYALSVGPALTTEDSATLAPGGGSASVRVSSRPSPFSTTCQAAPVEISEDLWRVSIVGGAEDLRPSGTAALLRYTRPRAIASVFAVGTAPEFWICPAGCPTASSGDCTPAWTDAQALDQVLFLPAGPASSTDFSVALDFAP